jgi:hypothetical protein
MYSECVYPAQSATPLSHGRCFATSYQLSSQCKHFHSTSRQLRYRHIMHPRNGNQPHTTGNYSSSHLLIIPTIKPEPFSALRFTQEKRKSRHHRSKRQIANRFPPSPVLFQFPNRARSSSRKDKSITFNFVRWFVRKAIAAMMKGKRTKEQVP